MDQQAARDQNLPHFLRDDETGELFYHHYYDTCLQKFIRAADNLSILPVADRSAYRPQRFSEDGTHERGVAADAKQMAVLEFQGSVVKVALRSKSMGGKINGAEDFYARGYALAFDRMAKGYEERYKFRNNIGQVIALDASEDVLHQIDLDGIKASRELYEARVGTRRGSISTFSRKSRKRLLELVSRLSNDAHGVFLTATYKKLQLDHKEAKKHLDKLRRWVEYHHPESAIIWRMEYQDRGAIHFHLLVFNVGYIPAKKLTAYWQKMTGDSSYPDVKRIENKRKAAYYVSKYIAKSSVASGDNGFISLPYSEKTKALSDLEFSELNKSMQDTGFVGRFWGVVNRAALPFAPLIRIAYSGSAVPIMQFRRLARRSTAGAFQWRSKVQGFTVFVGNAERWADCWRVVEHAPALDQL